MIMPHGLMMRIQTLSMPLLRQRSSTIISQIDVTITSLMTALSFSETISDI
jgi:hypothetical protein